MKKLILIILFTLFFSEVCVFCEIDTSIREYPEFNEYTDEITEGDYTNLLTKLMNNIKEALFGEIKRSKALLAKITVIAAVAAIIRLMNDSYAGQAAYFAVYTLLTATVLKLISEAVGYGKDVIHTISDFITKLTPILLGLIAVSGSPTSAAAFSPVLSSAVYILTIAVDKIITPIIFISAVIGVIGSFHDKVRLTGFNKLLRSISRWLLTLMLTFFVSICAVYGFNAPVFDALGAKTVKFAVGSMVPIVGGLLADSLETVIGGTQILKNAVGSAGMLCIVGICAIPLIKVWVILFLLKISAAIQEPICGRELSSMLWDASESVSTVFSLMTTSVMMFLICIGIIISSTAVR